MMIAGSNSHQHCLARCIACKPAMEQYQYNEAEKPRKPGLLDAPLLIGNCHTATRDDRWQCSPEQCPTSMFQLLCRLTNTILLAAKVVERLLVSCCFGLFSLVNAMFCNACSRAMYNPSPFAINADCGTAGSPPGAASSQVSHSCNAVLEGHGM